MSCATFVSWWAQYEEEEIICKSRFIEYKKNQVFSKELTLQLSLCLALPLYRGGLSMKRKKSFVNRGLYNIKKIKFSLFTTRRGWVVKGFMTVYLFLSVTVL